ncbi:MAG: protein translocase subunit SecF [Lachnospiraceae bacterium]|nr:protein translocase subunit SecF [Lachnospiraceae bacterium]
MKIIEKRKLWFLISGVIILAGLVSFIFRGFNLDIEFAGGTMLEFDLHQEVKDLSEIEAIAAEVSKDTNPQVQTVAGAGGDFLISIKVKEIDSAQISELYDRIAGIYGLDTENRADLISESSISPVISGEMKSAAVVSTVITCILILLYITVRFRDICFGLSALIPLIHDVLIMLAMYTLFRIPVNNTFIVALLTIVGYSINNTIVVFDRIRENRGDFRKNQLVQLGDTSVLQTLGRSLASSFTTIITVFLLFLLGVQSLRWFALPLLVGLLAGTYSSIFIATPIWYMLEKAIHKNS